MCIWTCGAFVCLCLSEKCEEEDEKEKPATERQDVLRSTLVGDISIDDGCFRLHLNDSTTDYNYLNCSSCSSIEGVSPLTLHAHYKIKIEKNGRRKGKKKWCRRRDKQTPHPKKKPGKGKEA